MVPVAVDQFLSLVLCAVTLYMVYARIYIHTYIPLHIM